MNTPLHPSHALPGEPDAFAADDSHLLPHDAGTPVKPSAPAVASVDGYAIVGELERGGWGVVYQANHLQLKRPAVLKMVLPGAPVSTEELHRLVTEVQAAARVQHPNILKVYDIGQHEGLPYFALEYVDGLSLEQYLRQQRLSDRQAAELVLTLARALAAAHSNGVVHRDLKPANILLVRNGTPKLTDFGLTKQIGHDLLRTEHGIVPGTPAYMAPEQVDGRFGPMGPHTDIWGLGAVLFELATGRPPFVAPTPFDTLRKVIQEHVPSPAQVRPDVPQELSDICLMCLQKDSPQRYASMTELASDLERYLNDTPAPPPARPAPPLAVPVAQPVRATPFRSMVPVPVVVPRAVHAEAPAPKRGPMPAILLAVGLGLFMVAVFVVLLLLS